MSDDTRSEYTVTVGGIEHTMLLTSEDAKRYADAAVPAKARDAANKAREAKTK